MPKANNTMLIGSAIALLGLSGCASIVSGQNQPVSVVTPGCEKAACELTNDKGKWYVSATPGTVTVQRSYSDMQVNCTKPDYSPTSASIKSTTKGMAFGNILLGGVIGAGVDMASGAAYDYPSEISVPMNCSPPSSVAALRASVESTSGTGIKLGCVVAPVSNEVALAAGLPSASGVLVTSVAPDSVAAASDIQVGDILTEFNSVPITSSAALRDLLSSHPAGERAVVLVFRQRETLERELSTQTKREI